MREKACRSVSENVPCGSLTAKSMRIIWFFFFISLQRTSGSRQPNQLEDAADICIDFWFSTFDFLVFRLWQVSKQVHSNDSLYLVAQKNEPDICGLVACNSEYKYTARHTVQTPKISSPRVWPNSLAIFGQPFYCSLTCVLCIIYLIDWKR